MNILYLFLPFSGEKSFFFVSDFNHASCMLTTDLSIDEDAGTPLHTHRPSLHPFCNFFASCLFRWHCSWFTSYSQCAWRMISSYPWCCCLIVVQSSFQLFLFCPYMLLVTFYTQSIASEHGFFLLCTPCTCWSVCLLLQGLSSTLKAPLLPLKAALALSVPWPVAVALPPHKYLRSFPL